MEDVERRDSSRGKGNRVLRQEEWGFDTMARALALAIGTGHTDRPRLWNENQGMRFRPWDFSVLLACLSMGVFQRH
jgi:hypothetical protein